MSAVMNAVEKWARLTPDAIAINGVDQALSYAQLRAVVHNLAYYLRHRKPRVVAVLVDNSPAWVALDLAAQLTATAILPIPGFFSAQQINHALGNSGCDLILTDQPQRFTNASCEKLRVQPQLSALLSQQGKVWEVKLTSDQQADHLATAYAKITYTSGTTGEPKGVCLQQQTIDAVAQSLCSAVAMNNRDRHLCVLPLATLLENIAGVYVPLLAGAQTFVYPLASVGLRGAVEFDAHCFLQLLSDIQATTTVLVPHLLQQFVELYEQSEQPLAALRFVAVGGAPVSAGLLQRAQHCYLPVFEGYGLSECNSVVAVNTPQQNRPGSVGKPLPHVMLKFADDGEILIKGAQFAGYLGDTAAQTDYLASGDLGYLDEDGYLYLTGRKKNMFITAFGRNVAPEWVERELVTHDAIHQAAVFGEARPWNVAVIVAAADATQQQIQHAIAMTNLDLPDYARIKTWLLTSEPFQLANQQLTATGRLRRQQIWKQYAAAINQLYLTTNDFESTTHEVLR